MVMEKSYEKQSVSSDDSSSMSSGDENKERGNWTGRLDFIMSCISYAVGLGNIWRFPYLCYRNGGAVFLIPYLIFLFLCGMPLFFIEVSYGQFASLSPITVWRLSPFFKGIGYGMVIISGIVCIYYNVIITWALYFLFNSFRSTLPWSTCDNWWNTENCMYYVPANGTNATMSELATNGEMGMNATIAPRAQRTTPSEEFWERNVLQMSDGIEDMGGIRWELFGCLALSWVIVFLCLIRGIKSSGRVVYFTATFPYLVLLTLLIRGLTLPGAMDGIRFYVIPDWSKLLTLQVWGEAAMQIFYSIGACWGALVTMASYNKFNNDCYRDARIVPLLNSGTSIFAGFVIYSIIGYLAHESGAPISEVVKQGPGLVFVIYPEAVSNLPLPQIWAVMFFAMLLSIGIGSQFAMFQTVISAFTDEFDFLKKRGLLLTAGLCVFEFLCGIPCIMNGGIYFLQIMDWYSSTFSLMIISLVELLVISWIYGLERFYRDIIIMIGYRPCIWWKIVWGGVTPVIIVCVLMFNIIMHTPVTYGEYTYPGWAIAIGWFFALCSIVPLPVIALISYFKSKGHSIKERLWGQVKPARTWGPALQHHRMLYIESLKEFNPKQFEIASQIDDNDVEMLPTKV